MPDSASSKVLLVGGGVGTAPMLYLGEQLALKGIKPTFLLGARSKKDLLQLDQFEIYGDLYTTTEDGTHGGKNSGSISAKTSFILAGENMGPAKLEKADKLGIKIISEEEFIDLIS